jgi:hypothetical protein
VILTRFDALFCGNRKREDSAEAEDESNERWKIERRGNKADTEKRRLAPSTFLFIFNDDDNDLR